MTNPADTSLLHTAVPDTGRPAPLRRERKSRIWWIALVLSVLLQGALVAVLNLPPHVVQGPQVFEINILSDEEAAPEGEKSRGRSTDTPPDKTMADDKNAERKPDLRQAEQPAQSQAPPSTAPPAETPTSAASLPSSAGATLVPTDDKPAPDRGPLQRPPEQQEEKPVEKPADAPAKQAAPKLPAADRSPKPAPAPVRTTGPAIPKTGKPNPPPPYPLEAKARGHEGAVRARVQIGPDGGVRGVTIVQSSGYVEIDRSVQDTLMEWHFVPATMDGRPIEGSVTLGFDFRLNG